MFSLPKLSKIRITTFFLVGFSTDLNSVIGLKNAFNSASEKNFGDSNVSFFPIVLRIQKGVFKTIAD